MRKFCQGAMDVLIGTLILFGLSMTILAFILVVQWVSGVIFGS